VQVVTDVSDIVLVDINGYSSLSTELQLESALYITSQLNAALNFLLTQANRQANEIVLGFIPTGDGFYVVLSPPLAGYGIFLAITLRASLLMKRSGHKLPFSGVRLAVHNGEIAPFTDIVGKANFVGEGLNSCTRLLSARAEHSPDPSIPVDENTIVVSDAAYHQFRALCGDNTEMNDFLASIQYAETDWFEISDKHGNVHRLRFVEASHYAAIELP